MAERLTLSEHVAGTAVLTASGSESLTFSEYAAGIVYLLGHSNESLTFGEHATGILETVGISRERLSLSEYSRGAVSLRGASNERLLFREHAGSELNGRSREALAFREHATAVSLITGVSREGFAFSEKLRGAIIETDDVVWVINLKTGGHARYTGDLSGATPVEAYALTPSTDFGTPHQKHVYDAYHDMRSSGDVELTTITDEETVIDGYIVPFDGREGLHRRRCQLARGVRGNQWQFKIANVAGANFIHKGLEVLPVVSQRVGR